MKKRDRQRVGEKKRQSFRYSFFGLGGGEREGRIFRTWSFAFVRDKKRKMGGPDNEDDGMNGCGCD